MECQHDWQPRPNGIKEACSKCGAAQMINPARCNHEWVKRAQGGKEDCTKCGVARIALDVHDVKSNQTAENPL